MEDKKYGVSYLVSDYLNDPNIWERVKKELTYQMSMNIIPPLIGDGKYHVLKFDIAKRWIPDRMATEYALIVNHSIAQQKTFTIAKIEEIEYNGHKYERVCLHCGNKLIHDKRGSCSGCGAPNGGYK